MANTIFMKKNFWWPVQGSCSYPIKDVLQQFYTKKNKKTWVYFTADPGKNKKLNYE